MISVIIPFYNRWDLTHRCLSELFSFVKDIEIVLVNDASTDPEIPGGVSWWQKQVFPLYGVRLRYVKNEVNLGFGGAMNTGVAHARGEIVVLLSNDVIVNGDFSQQVRDMLRLDPKTLIGGRVLYFDTGWNRFNFDGKDTIIPYAEGWFIACTRDAWDDIGGFDDRFLPYDYDDLDLSLTAISKGYKLAGMNSGHLKHMSGQTIMTVNPDRMAVTERNRIRFYDKWKEEVPNIFEKLETVGNDNV